MFEFCIEFLFILVNKHILFLARQCSMNNKASIEIIFRSGGDFFTYCFTHTGACMSRL